MSAPMNNMALRTFSYISRVLRNTPRFYSKFQGAKRNKLIQRHDRNLNKLFGIQHDESTSRNKWKKNAMSIPYGTGHVTEVSQRRAKQLSVYLLEHVCNAFYQGEICPELIEYNLEIDKVKLSPDLGHLSVFWNASGKLERDARVEYLLENSKRDLRSLLTQKQLMGRIPPITFVKNMTNAKLQMVEELLKRADFGPDHAPTDLGHDLKTPIDLTKYRTNSAEKSQGENNYLYAEGPGGSREILWGEESPSAHSEWTDGTAKPQVGMVDKMSELDNSESSVELLQVGSKFRHDIYDLHRDELLEKVLHVKKRSADRSYRVPSSQMSEGLADRLEEIQIKNVSRGSLQQYLSRKKEKDFRRQKRRNFRFSELDDKVEMFDRVSEQTYETDGSVHDDEEDYTDYYSQK